MKKLIGFTIVAAFALSVYASEYPDITIKQLKSDISAKKVTLLDANGTETWQKGHISGAINFEASQQELAKVLPKDKKALIVAYCGNPRCKAYQAAAKVMQTASTMFDVLLTLGH